MRIQNICIIKLFKCVLLKVYFVSCCFSKFFHAAMYFLCTIRIYVVYASWVMINLPRTTNSGCVRFCVCHTVSVNPLVCAIVCLNVFNKHHFNPEWWCRENVREKKKEKTKKSGNIFRSMPPFMHKNGFSSDTLMVGHFAILQIALTLSSHVRTLAHSLARRSQFFPYYWGAPIVGSLHIYYLRWWE